MTTFWSTSRRAESIQRLRSQTFDLAVIGGGINGAAIARDAALRGLRVALVDRGDFAGATSSESSKLIHGGLRYLPQLHLGLVREALAERERLRHLTAPHLVRPIRFLFPLYAGRGVSKIALKVGLTLYDLMAGVKSDERHRSLSPEEVAQSEPALSRSGVRGAMTYVDAVGDDARLTIENLLDAAEHGAVVVNYLGVEALERVRGRLAAAWVRERLSGERVELKAARFVNACGPWVDLIRRLDDHEAGPIVRLTKGVHIVIDRDRLPLGNALVLGDGGGRIIFAIPGDGHVLIGTTDTDFDGEPETAAPTTADVRYLLDVLNHHLAGPALREHDVAYGFAGLRALVMSGHGAPSAVSREEVIVESASGLLSIAGGKLTTHRFIAKRVLGRVMEGGGGGRASPTDHLPLPGARSHNVLGAGAGLPAFVRARYGARVELVAQIAAARPELLKPLAPGCQAIGAEVIMAVRHEWALEIDDFLRRRTGVAWRQSAQAAAAVPVVARLMGEELGWGAAARQDREALQVRRLEGWREA